MQYQQLGLIVGGLVPAVLFGINGVLNKVAVLEGIGMPVYFIFIGMGAIIVGLITTWYSRDHRRSAVAVWAAVGAGVSWSLAVMGSVYAIGVLQVPLSKLVPLYNMNTLIAVILAFWIFQEHRSVRVPSLLLGSVLIVVGGTIVTIA